MNGARERVSRRPAGYCFSPVWLGSRKNTKHINEALDRFQSGRLLDLGCGIKPFERVKDGIEWIGFDVEGNPFADVHGSALELPFEANSFDCVLSTQVLEHVEDPARMLAECTRVLRPGGLLILSAPQYWELHEEPYDYFRFTVHGLRVLCEKAGISILETRREGCGVELAALAFNSAINHFGPYPDSLAAKMLKAPVYLAVNLGALALGSIFRNDRDVQNYTITCVVPKGGAQ